MTATTHERTQGHKYPPDRVIDARMAFGSRIPISRFMPPECGILPGAIAPLRRLLFASTTRCAS